jgi:hypothetical protein
MLELGESFAELDRAQSLRADVRAMPSGCAEMAIRDGAIAEAACGIAAIAEAYVAVGRPDAAVAELVAFTETVASTFAAIGREMSRERDADFAAKVRQATLPCPRPRRSRPAPRRGGG